MALLIQSDGTLESPAHEGIALGTKPHEDDGNQCRKANDEEAVLDPLTGLSIRHVRHDTRQDGRGDRSHVAP